MMNKTILLLALMLSFSAVYAQKSAVSKAKSSLSSGQIEEALDLINQAIDPNNEKAEKTIPWATTWEVRGDIYAEMYKTGSTLAENPLDTAIESYKKAIELDGKGSSSVKATLTLLLTEISNKAIESYNAEDYSSAYTAFDRILEIENLPIIQEDGEFVDTTTIFNAGLAAQNAGMYNEAIKYYEDAAQYDYNGSQLYEQISQCYTSLADTTAALETLKKGYEKFPESNSIIISMINMYLSADKGDEALKYLDLAIESDPSNASFYFVKGTLYDNMKDYDNAIEFYNKAIDVDNYHDAYYNIGVIYYNQGVSQLDVANAVPTNEPDKYEEEKAKADELFEKAIPYLEEAIKLDPSDVYSLESLRSLYLRLKMTDKYNEVNEMLENM